MGILGTQTDLVDTLNAKYLEDEGEFKKKADRIRQGREDSGKASMYSRLQPWNRPAMSDLLHERIDLLWPFDVGPRWCQGEVIKVYENRSNNKVRVL